VRWGLAALLAAQIVGLNLWAWHQRAAIENKQLAMFTMVKTAFPRLTDNEIRLGPMPVLQREVDTLRLRAGKPGETDFEPMLQAAALAWPAEQPPVENLRYENGRLTLAATGWREPQLEQFRSRLRPAGWQVEQNEGRVTITRARTGAAP
jgi:general secretion pathway protein L